MDRFMFMLDVGYPTPDDEVAIVRATTGASRGEVKKVLSPEKILEMQALVRRVPAPENVAQHAVSLVRATRPESAGERLSGAAKERIGEFVSFGAGPRASQYLVLGAKTRAALHGRPSATVDDVRALAVPVLAHRVVTNFHAEADGVKPSDLVRDVLKAVPA
jgi:MoxR-like ATPase